MMESVPSKRRKTSPSTHVPVTAQFSQTRPLPQDGGQISSSRASFMSPTKASLARFNPNLLPQSNLSEPLRPRSQGSDSERPRTRDGINGHAYQQARSGLVESSDTVRRSIETPMLGANGQGLRATPRRRSRNLGIHYSPSTSTRPPVFPNPRASPPEEARERGDGLQAIHGVGQAHIPHEPDTEAPSAGTNGVPRTSQSPRLPSTPTHPGLPRATSDVSFSEHVEPSLPSTPIHLGLEDPPERPKGLLFNSPSRRTKRKGPGATNSSPLKPVGPAPEHRVSKSSAPLSNLGPRVFISSTPRPAPNEEETAELRMRESLVALEKQLQDIEHRLIRQTLVSNWQPQDSKEMKELSKLKKQVSAKSTKVSRLREEAQQYGIVRSIDQDPASMTLAHREEENSVP